jgi:hypothetical protein
MLPILFGSETFTIVSGEEYCRLKVSEVIVPRGIFGPVKKAGENYAVYFVICTAHQILE